MVLPNRLLPVAAAFAACLVLSGCDDQQREHAVQSLKDFFNSVKPDVLLLKNLTPGISTMDDVRRQMGKPETERALPDGGTRFEYPRGPQGLTTYFVDFSRGGMLVSITQVLTAANFARVQPGMSEDEVRRLLGKPAEVAEYPLKPETVWSWRWLENGVTPEAFFNVHFDREGRVYTTSRSDVVRGR